MIPTGIHLHAPMTVDALITGANVFVEKPAAATIQDVDAMMNAAEEAERFVAVGYQRIFDPTMMNIKKRIIRGDIGRIKTATCQALWPRNDEYYARNGWAGRLKVGDAWVLDSPFNNALSHDLAMMCFLTGASLTSSVAIDSVQAELYRARDIESADTCAIRVKTVCGPEMLYAVTHACSTQSGPTMRFTGERGSIVLTHESVTIDVRGRGVETLRVRRGIDTRASIRDALYKRCRGDDAFICDLGIARAQTLVVNAAHHAAPVRPIDASLVCRVEKSGAMLSVIAGIDEAIARCADEMKLFSEIGASWAKPSKEFCVQGYDSFTGCRTP
jgi:predicted dehydrogenase